MKIIKRYTYFFHLEESLNATQYVRIRQGANETAYNCTIKMCHKMDLIVYSV